MKKGSLRSQIRQMCCLGLPAETLMPRLLPLVRQLVPAESAGFFWVDSTGAMQNLIAERMLPTAKMRLYFDHFYEGGAFDFRRGFTKRATSGKDVSVLEVDATFKRSDYYNEILRELDAHHVLHGIVRNQGDALGQISLYRSPKDSPFEREHEAGLNSVLHYIAHAVSAVPATGQDAIEMLDTDDDAILLADAAGRLLHASEIGRRLLFQAADGQFAPGALAVSDNAAVSLVRQLVKVLRKEPEMLPLVTTSGRWGQVTLRAYRTGAQENLNSPIAIRVTRREPMLLRFANAMRSLDLSPQMQEIALQLAQGRSNSEIAESMALTSNTVNYHVKALFAKLGTHGRTETVQQILRAQG
jgi:DNA-binding NarL/FixJ family response regulator